MDLHNTVLTLTLDAALVGKRNERRPLQVYLACRDGQWLPGLGNAHTWNKTYHDVTVETLVLDETHLSGAIRVTLNPDSYVPAGGQPLPATFRLQARVTGDSLSGAFEGVCGDSPVQGVLSGALGAWDAVRIDDCEIELLLEDAQRWSDIDWMRMARVAAEYEDGRIIRNTLVTKYGEMTLVLHCDASGLELTHDRIGGQLTFTLPSHPDGPDGPRTVTYPLKGYVRGTFIGGTFERTDADVRGAFPLRGRFKGTIRSKHQDVRGPFIHAGLLNTREELVEIAAHVRAGDEPWTSGCRKLQADLGDVLAHQPRPMRRYVFTHASMPGHSRDLLADGTAVYGCALLWAVTADARYADKAIEILNAYANTLTAIEPWDGVLGTSYGWPQFVWAAEIIRATTDRWVAADQARFTELLLRVVYPVGTIYVVDNNWKSWSICLRMAIALYTDDPGRFAIAVQDFRDHLPDYFHPSGHCRETGRDLWHTQMAIAPLLAAAEMAWKQGVDLYSLDDCQLLKGVEYHIPFIANDLSAWPLSHPPRAVGKWWNMYELAYHHYHGRLGLEIPRTRALLRELRPEGYDRIGWGTLTHPGL